MNKILLLSFLFSIATTNNSIGQIIWDGGGADNNWSTAANWVGDVVPGVGDDVRFTGGVSNKDCTIDVSPSIISFEVYSNYTGAVSLGSNTLTLSGDLSIGSGNFDAGTGTVVLTGDATISSQSNFYDLNINLSDPSFKIIGSGNLEVDNDLIITSQNEDSNYFIAVNGDVNIIDTNIGNPSSASIKMVGNGNSALDGAVGGTYPGLNIEIGKTNATDIVTLGNSMEFGSVIFGTGTFDLNSFTLTSILNSNMNTPDEKLVGEAGVTGGAISVPIFFLASGAVMSPGGGAAGCISFPTGSVGVTGGHLLMNLGGSTACTEYDQLQVTGNISFSLSSNATIEVTLINGFTPVPGQSFQLISAGSYTFSGSGDINTIFPAVSGIEWSYDRFTGVLTAGATSNIWNGNAGDNDWYTDGNWSAGHVPTNMENAQIPDNAGTINIGSGTAQPFSATVGSNSTLFIASGATLHAPINDMQGKLEGLGTIIGDVTLSNNGTVYPGIQNSGTTGTLTITGNYDQSTNGTLQIQVNGSSDNSVLSVSGTATIGPNLQVFNSYSPSPGDNFVFLDAGSISGTFSNTTTGWDITYNDPSTGNVKATYNPPAPSNDDCSGAENITLGFYANGYTFNAANSVSPTPSCHSGGQYDVWYSFTAPASGEVIINGFNADAVNGVVVYSGSCGSLTAVDCLEPANNGNVCNQLILSGLTSGNTYYIQIVTDNQTSNIGLSVDDAGGGPANDFCSGAIAAAVGSPGDCPTGQVSGTTLDAHHSQEVSCAQNYQCNYLDVWYSFTAPASGYLKYIPGTNNPIAVIYSGGCGSLTEEACLTSESQVPLTGGNSYLLQIALNSNGGNGMAFDFCLEEGVPPPANNECTGAIAISVSANGGCSNESGTTLNATSSLDFVCSFGPANYLDVWYSFTAPSGGAVTFHSGSNSPVAVVYDGSCGSLSAVANGCFQGSGTVGGLTSGNTYYLQVLTGGGTGMTFDFCLEVPGSAPSNSACANAIAIDLGNPLSINTTYALTEELPYCAPLPSLNAPELWYTFTAPASGEIGYAFSGGTIILTVLKGTCGNWTEQIACAVPLAGGPPSGLTPGDTYYAQISSLGTTSSGSATINAPDDYSFTGANSNSWNTGTNWKSGAVPEASSSVTIPNGESCTLDVDHTHSGTITVESGGSLTIQSGMSLTNNGTITNNGTFTNEGTLMGSGSQSGNFVNPNGSTVAPGTSPGCMSFGNDFDNLGIIEIELGGTTVCTEYDQLQVSGTATFGGTLTVSLINGYTPTVGTTFQIVTASGFSGTFTTYNFPAVSGIQWSFVPSTGILTAQSSLPVELMVFNARKVNNSVDLDWRTATEHSNSGFDIQRSMNGTAWEGIAFVTGHGTTLEEQSYSYSDERPLPGLNYYRLKQMDYDGHFEYSKIISIDLKKPGGGIRISPNPASQYFTLTLDTEHTGEAQLQLFDTTGRQVKSQQLQLEGDTFRTEIGLEGLAAGLYLVKLQNGRQAWQERLVVK